MYYLLYKDKKHTIITTYNFILTQNLFLISKTLNEFYSE